MGSGYRGHFRNIETIFFARKVTIGFYVIREHSKLKGRISNGKRIPEKGSFVERSKEKNLIRTPQRLCQLQIEAQTCERDLQWY